jgi:hypothetical protein
MITLQEAIALLPAIEKWEINPNPIVITDSMILAVATREHLIATEYSCQLVVKECNRIYTRAYRDLIREGKV